MSFFEFPHTRTYDSDLGWLIKHVNEYDDIFQELNNWIAENTPKIDDMLAFMEELEAGNLPPGMKNALYEWASQNLYDLIGAAIKSVFFEITDDGYFVAWIPDSWDDITFNTTYYDINLVDHPEVEFGHLVLSY